MGVNALTVGAIEVLLHRWPDAEIFILDYGVSPGQYTICTNNFPVEVPLVNLRFSKKLLLPNHVLVVLLLAAFWRAVPIVWFRRWIEAVNPYIAKVSSAEIAASVAGGDSFSDIYGIQNFFYIALPQLICLLLGKRLIVLPQTFGPFRSRIARFAARRIMGHALRLYSRDYEGLQFCRNLLGSGFSRVPIRFAHDMGILLEPHQVRDRNFEELLENRGARPIVGLNVSGLLCKTGGDFGRSAGFVVDYDQLIREIIAHLIGACGASVFLVPHVLGEGRESDVLLCKRLCEELGPRFGPFLGATSIFGDQHNLKYLIGSCDFFIGSRMHACIAAVSQCVPAVSLAYSSKFAGVMETVGLSHLVADLRASDLIQTIQLVESSLSKRGEYRALLVERMPTWKDSVMRLLDDLQL
jgi:polysaccharide pyruvyl transferase WcaK-like protein